MWGRGTVEDFRSFLRPGILDNGVRLPSTGTRQKNNSDGRFRSPVVCANQGDTLELVDLLNSDAAELPFTGQDDLEKQLRDRFDSYFVEAAKVSSSDAAATIFLGSLADSKKLADALVAALGHWLDAEPDEALNALDSGLTPLDPKVVDLTSKEVPGSSTGPMFRTRVGQLGDRLSAGEMFHIPFEMRDRVATQRYSFPGLPCLYLGRSIYVCWEEMGRPDLHSLWISKFEVAPGQHVQVLDFGHRPALVAAGLAHTQDSGKNGITPAMAAAYAALWPLIAGCSVRRHPSRKRSFVVEYVIPQLLLRWLVRRMRNGKGDILDGIRYFSSHIEDHDVGLAGMNYVFPAQVRAKTGYCTALRSKFHLTPPTNWQIAISGQFAPPHTSYNNVRFAMTPGWVEDYKFTNFGRVEAFVDQLAAGAV